MSTVDEPTTLVIRNGTVIDGTGAPGHRADVLIADGKIVEIGKLTGQQADLFGFDDRGYLQPGMWADITVFDPATVDPGPVRRVRDFPADAERLTADAERLTADAPTGIKHVLINGQPIQIDGTPIADAIAAKPGQLVRPAARNR